MKEAANKGKSAMSKSEFEKTVEIPGVGKVTTYADNSTSFEAEGVKGDLDEDGKIRLHLEKLEKVSIDNLADVKSHSIEHGQTATSHHVVFRNGGEVRL